MHVHVIFKLPKLPKLQAEMMIRQFLKSKGVVAHHFEKVRDDEFEEIDGYIKITAEEYEKE